MPFALPLLRLWTNTRTVPSPSMRRSGEPSPGRHLRRRRRQTSRGFLSGRSSVRLARPRGGACDPRRPPRPAEKEPDEEADEDKGTIPHEYDAYPRMKCVCGALPTMKKELKLEGPFKSKMRKRCSAAPATFAGMVCAQATHAPRRAVHL